MQRRCRRTEAEVRRRRSAYAGDGDANVRRRHAFRSAACGRGGRRSDSSAAERFRCDREASCDSKGRENLRRSLSQIFIDNFQFFMLKLTIIFYRFKHISFRKINDNLAYFRLVWCFLAHFNIKIRKDAVITTDCSQALSAGTRVGSWEVVDGRSSHGGLGHPDCALFKSLDVPRVYGMGACRKMAMY